jgi:GNAT superfamily N-acetyltransferase
VRFAVSTESAMAGLARDPLRHIVLLKQLQLFPQHLQAYRVSDARGTAVLLALDVSASPYDRQAYPEAAIAAFVASDHPDLTATLLSCLPRGTGIVFKLSQEADVPAVASRFAAERRTAFVSFTATGAFAADPEVRVTAAPSDAAFRMFEAQGHERAWLEPLLKSGRGFACVLDTRAVCLAFENYGPVWEVGGVVTAPAQRRQGYGARVVRTALSRLGERGLKPRYQVEERNTASIRLAERAGLVPFVTIVHYLSSARRSA